MYLLVLTRTCPFENNSNETSRIDRRSACVCKKYVRMDPMLNFLKVVGSFPEEYATLISINWEQRLGPAATVMLVYYQEFCQHLIGEYSYVIIRHVTWTPKVYGTTVKWAIGWQYIPKVSIQSNEFILVIISKSIQNAIKFQIVQIYIIIQHVC